MSAHRAGRFAVALVALALVAAACGKDTGGGGGSGSGQTGKIVEQTGGTFRIASSADVDYMDPGQIYYTFSNMLFRVMIRNLVHYPALNGEAGNKLVPDIATSTGSVSADGKTYTFVIKDGVKFQPGTAGGRAVESKDFRYAIERGFYSSVANGYAHLYFEDLFEGDEEFIRDAKPDNGKHINGIDVSDPRKIVFHLKHVTGDFLYRLAMPLAAPVPEEYAKPFDAKTQSDYGASFAATGPYQIERDPTGNHVTGYEAGKRIVMVRNKNWNRATDTIRRAFPDKFEVVEGFEDTAVATDKILNGEFDLNGDFQPPPEKIEGILANAAQKTRIFFDNEPCLSYVALNTTLPPFDKVEVRKAVAYVLDRNAMLLTRGGARTGKIATNVLIPGLNGFEESGGFNFDPYSSPNHAGDVNKARELMKQAFPPDGKYNGPSVYLVGGNAGVAPKTTNVVQSSLEKIGIKVRREEYKGNIMYTKYANVPSQKVQVLTNVGWCWDYPDAFTVVSPLFDGRKITPSGNNNYAQINDSELNSIIDSAANQTGTKRAATWAKANKRIMDLVPVVPWRWPSAPEIISARALNFTFSLFSASMDLAVAALKPGSK